MSYFGRVKSVSLKRNAKTGQSRRYGYVKFYLPGPIQDIYEHEWYIGEKRIRIKKYQINPCWKNDYMSDENTDEDVVVGDF
jgi:RNA recognition motif-containing protein